MALGALLGCAMTVGSAAFFACKKSEDAAQAERAAPPNPTPSQPEQTPAELNEVVALIDEEKITVADFQDRINKQSPYVRARYTSLEQKKDFLDNLVRFEVLAKEAKKRGYDKDPEVVRTMKQVMIQKLMKDEFEARVTPESITDAEIKAYYDGQKDEFVKAEEVRASAIVVKTRAQAVRVYSVVPGD